MSRRNLKGFTLIELLVVISVGAMLTLLSIPLFNSVIYTEDLDTVSEDILSSLRTAQSRSINGSNGTEYGVYFDNTVVPNRYVIFRGISYNPAEPTNEVFELSERIRITDINFNGGEDYLVFDKYSGETSGFGNIVVENNIDASRIITITQIGLTDVADN
jgi:prepilin-type N-terminal cleavage/methylation domain-containing protein